jgi:hypothetical protein
VTLKRGRMTTEHTVWCANGLSPAPHLWPYGPEDRYATCHQHLQVAVPGRVQAAAQAEADGWTFTRRYGWLCVRCSRRAGVA